MKEKVARGSEGKATELIFGEIGEAKKPESLSWGVAPAVSSAFRVIHSHASLSFSSGSFLLLFFFLTVFVFFLIFRDEAAELAEQMT